MWKLLGLISLSLLVGGCAVPIAWSTAPVSPLKHPKEEGMEFYGGLRAGQPTQEDAVERFYASGFLGLVSQSKWLTFNLTGWGATGRYLFRRTYFIQGYDSIVPIQVRATAFHLQTDIGLSAPLNEGVRIESGIGLGAGIERWRRSELYYLEKNVPAVTPTLAAFIGTNIALTQRTAIGFRWHFIGAGTGFTASVRHGRIQVFASTQPVLLAASASNASYLNWTLGMMGFFPVKDQ
ncbi:MAG: hypothetical protein NZ580_03805 [Bacteroidia bacterium]|nr:hypothetical protein [Bacteroidia bacterium]MDW8235453.1 hypothetical protein [Bacteroidia bacterium]